jgi:hypothetical protein
MEIITQCGFFNGLYDLHNRRSFSYSQHFALNLHARKNTVLFGREINKLLRSILCQIIQFAGVFGHLHCYIMKLVYVKLLKWVASPH